MIKTFNFIFNADTTPLFREEDNEHNKIGIVSRLHFIKDLVDLHYAIPLTEVYMHIFAKGSGDFWNCMNYILPKQLIDRCKYKFNAEDGSYTITIVALEWDKDIIFDDNCINRLIAEGEEN